MLRVRPPSVAFALGMTAILLLSGGAVQTAMAATTPGQLPVAADTAQQARRSVVWVPMGSSSSPTGFRISSESVGAPSPDEFQITYQNGAFSLNYQRQAGGPVTSSFTVTVKTLVEWVDVSGDGLIADGSIVAYFPMGNTGFGAIPIQHSQSAGPSGGEVHTFQITSNNGEVRMDLTISEGFLALSSGDTLTPMEAKLSFLINHVLSRSTGRLGLQLGMDTAGTVALENHSWDEEHSYSRDERALNITNGSGQPPSSAFFAWSSVATVNGQAGGVTVTGPEPNETVGGRDVYLAYPAGPASLGNPLQVKVVHDPTIGVVSAAFQSIVPTQPPIQLDYPLYLVTMVGVAVLVLGTAILSSRRRRERL